MRTFGQFIWSLYYAMKQRDDMFSYLKENARYLDCELFPSKNLMKRYSLGEHGDLRAWAIIEEHIEKAKDIELGRTRHTKEQIDILASQAMKPTGEVNGIKTYVFDGYKEKKP
jgi:hypothetical protein